MFQTSRVGRPEQEQHAHDADWFPRWRVHHGRHQPDPGSFRPQHEIGLQNQVSFHATTFSQSETSARAKVIILTDAARHLRTIASKSVPANVVKMKRVQEGKKLWLACEHDTVTLPPFDDILKGLLTHE